MRDQTGLQRLCLRALKGDREVEDFIDTSEVRTVKEAQGLLDILAEVARAPDKPSDDGLMVVIRLLEYSRGAAVKFILREGLLLLDRLAGQLPSQSWAWAQALHAMAYFATKGSRQGLTCWCRHFLAPDPGREAEIYELAAAPLLVDEATCTRHLFPELLRALACPAKRLAVVQVADAAFGYGHLPNHPLRGELEVLAELLMWSGGDNTRTPVAGALVACTALNMIESAEATEVLKKALACQHPGIRLRAASLLAPDGNEQALDVLVQATLVPLTTCEARSCLNELGHNDLIPVQAYDATLNLLGKFARTRDHFTFSGCGPLVSVELAAERKMPWPPHGKTVTARLVRLHLRDADEAPQLEIAGGVGDRGPYCLRGVDPSSAEDCLAYLCYRNLVADNLIVEDECGEGYDRLLGQWRKGRLENASVVTVADLSPRLRFGRRLVAIAAARRQGRDGYVILDGGDSIWKPSSKTGNEDPRATLGVYIGRRLLDLARAPDYS